ncbi:undecaprenyl/decaprenyl-phosphate alpha-N-acetylglucosaminyl 1-phosphate transferase [filamentous cyanobacterium LEGE 11480]|uniref:Undecaprenyl/decaprenyl-phosphate alpha-N-acetylglucosaminyl 1-phosphate transferase n=1 Tax=Romeriopsis navalis LEGE 11480 TaxID=2777977 RepID=A0A928VK51_9CYAN|nr:MraY family glycosyltransferase [Romeriopsis navalis]MBE9029820.1 undecaprenyl/decaprenyl-phosphate alpha-N-acetylglucosaminyl 1-phosphate transferase [Romeriopsis navalis LEGE 11480]
MKILAVFAIALFVVRLISPIVKQLGLKFGFVDQPDARKLHNQPMVRMGGVGIGVGAGIAGVIGIWWQADTITLHHSWLTIMAMFVAGMGFFAIGLADDRWSLSPKLRLGLQAVVTCLAWALGLQMHNLPIPGVGTVALGYWSLPVTFLWLAGVTNALNWLDGLDGLAAGVTGIAALTFAAIGWQQQDVVSILLSLSLAGASFGFLRYNAFPAQMYMGDGGSYFIGGMLAGLGILCTGNSDSFSLTALPYVVLALPILDMVLVIGSRVFGGKSPFFPDQRHIHHRLLRLHLTKQASVVFIYILALWAAVTANWLLYTPWAWSNVVLLALLLTFVNRAGLQTASTQLGPVGPAMPAEA